MAKVSLSKTKHSLHKPVARFLNLKGCHSDMTAFLLPTSFLSEGQFSLFYGFQKYTVECYLTIV